MNRSAPCERPWIGFCSSLLSTPAALPGGLTSGYVRGIAGLVKRHEWTNHSIDEQRTMLPFQFDNWP
jgi:hypothetical protein